MIITYILQVTLCLAFFYALYYAVLQKETLFRTNRLYLLSTLIASLALPLIRIYILDHQQEVSIGTAPIYVGAYLENMNDVIVAPRQHAFPWLGVLTALYKGVVIFLVCRLLESVLSIFRMQRAGEKIFLYGQKCVLNPQVRSPFSFFNTIYLPKDHQFSDSELEEIITHEKTHVQGRHTLDVLFIELICCALWPSPMVYLYRKKLRELHEFLADAEVLKNTPWENYASFLIAQKNEGLQQRLSNQMFYSQLKNRLIMMNKQRSFRSANLKYFGIIPILLLALVVFSFREKSVPGTGEDPKIELTVTHDKKYFLDGKEIPYEQLEQSLSERIKNNLERKVFIHMDSTVTAEDLEKVMSLGEKFNIVFTLESTDSHSAPHPDLAKFLIVVEKTDNELKLTCKDGCAWKSLTFNSSVFDEPQAIDQNGMTTVSATQPVNDPEHPNFLFTIKGEGDRVNLIGIEGTAWTKLSFTRHNSLWIQAIDQFGLTTIDEEGHSTSVAHLQYYPQDTLPATVVTAYRFAEPPADVDRSIEYKADPDIYEDMAIFPGCEDVPIRQRGMCGQTNLMGYINSHLIYPESLKKANIQGKVVVRFTVGIDGYVKNFVIEKSLSPDADDAVLKVFKNMNKEAGRWMPARKGGKTMEAEMTLPVSFSLGAAEEKTVWDEPYTQVEQMPRFPGCEEFTKTIMSSDISKGEFNFPPGSVIVTSGGKELKENEDYTIDYKTSRIKIVNQVYMQPETSIKVSFKNDDKTNCANEAMFKYIYSAVKYPQEDREKGNEGMVIAQFTVSADGNISNIKVVRGVSPGLDAEIVRVINGMNDLPEKWIPGKHNGNAVPVQLTLPFKFVLQPNPTKENDKDSEQISTEKMDDVSTNQKNEVLREIPLLIFHCPNPVSDVLKVEFFSWVQNVSIFNPSGQLVWSKKLDKNDHAISVDVDQWASGQYIIQGVKGQESKTISFVVQHD